MGERRVLAILALICAVGLLSSCAKKSVRGGPGEEPDTEYTAVTAEPEPWTPDQDADIMEDTVDFSRPPSGPAVEIPELQTVYFDYDKHNLRTDALEMLQQNLRWLRMNPDRQVLIEGHCDERGSEEYNLSLGDKRAKEVMRYLAKSGVLDDRMYTISYGEEFPAAPGHSEAAWSKNRRAIFKVYE